MIYLMRRIIITLAMLLMAFNAFAQTDTTFWFVAPEVSNMHGDRPIYLNVTTLDKAATVTISMPANSAFTTQTHSLAANTTKRIDLSTWINQIENNFVSNYDSSIPGKNNKGIFIQSTENITSYYEVARNNNCDLFSLKGKNALGSEFYVPFQNRFYNYNYADNPRSSANIVFTEDDTYITIDIPVGKRLYTGTTPLTGTVRLGPFNRGETFHATPQSLATNSPRIGRLANEHLSGLHVKAHDVSGTILKNIAITQNDDSMKSLWGGWDVGGDQIVPLDIIGKEYIAIKGDLQRKGSTYQESVYVLATEDNTKVYTDGGFRGTINRGETYMHQLVNNVTDVSADKPIYVWQITGFGNEMGGAILPAVDKCTGSQSVSFTRSVGQRFKLIVLVRTGSEKKFTSNRSAVANKLNNYAFSTIGSNPYWKAARIDFTTSEIPVGQTTVISNTDDIFHIGIINGDTGGGTRYGYFSGFGDIPAINAAPKIDGYALCAGDMILKVIGNPYTTYQWYRNNTKIVGATADTYEVLEPGRYKVTAMMQCAGVTTETFPSNTVDAIPCIKVTDVSVTEGQPNAEVTIEMTHFMPVDVKFDYATTDITARNGKDYTETRGRGTIPANKKTVKISIPITDDNFNEPDETFKFTISNADLANISETEATVTIKDDGDIPSKIIFKASDNVDENVAGGKYNLLIKLDKESGYTINANYSIADGTATKPADYNCTATGVVTFTPDETEKNVEITIVDDNIYEPNALGYETINASLSGNNNSSIPNSNCEIRIIDNEVKPTLSSSSVIGTEGSDMVFTVNLSSPCSENVSANYQIKEGTATNGSDYTFATAIQNLIFTPGQTSKQITIPVANDGISEVPETLTLNITNPVNATISANPLIYTGTITDNSGKPMLFIDDASVTEGGVLQFKVNTTLLRTSITNFSFSITNITTSNGDYTLPSPLTGTIAKNSASTIISVQTKQDTQTEGNETLSVKIAVTGNAVGIVKDTATGTIVDDDETPVAKDDLYTCLEDPAVALSGNVITNDTGLGDTPINIVVTSGVANGTLNLNTTTGEFTYMPKANYHGDDSFTYKITDADGETSTAIVTITVTSVNDTPVGIDDSYNVLERNHPSFTLLYGDVKDNDKGLGDNAKAEIVTNGTKGTVWFYPNNTFVYEPSGQNFGEDKFTYRLKDDDGQTSAITTATVNIQFYNNYAPQGIADSYSTPENTPITFNVTTNDNDQDGNSTINLGSIIKDRAPTKGTITYDPNTGNMTYTPNAGATGFEDFYYKISDKKIGAEPVFQSAWTLVRIEILKNKIKPTARCKNITLALNNLGKVTLLPANIDNGSSDADGTIASRKVNGVNSLEFDCSDAGTTKAITLTVIDNDGLQDECTAQVTIVDNIAPTVNTNTANITVYCGSSDAGKAVTYTAPTFNDNCAGSAVNGVLFAGKSSGSFFNVGTTTVTYKLDDGNGNAVATSSFTVTVINEVEVNVTTDKTGNNVCENDNITVKANCTGTTNPYTYSLYINNVLISGPVNNSEFTIGPFVFDETTPANNIKKVKIEVVDKNNHSVTSSEITVTVKREPETGTIFFIDNDFSI